MRFTFAQMGGSRVIFYLGEHYFLDYSKKQFTRQEVFEHYPPVNFDAYRRAVIDANIFGDGKNPGHLGMITREHSIKAHSGSEGGTVVLVAPGPSSAGVKDRLKSLPRGVKVATLNHACMFTDNQDYALLFEQMVKPEWDKHINPDRTTLITAPHAHYHLVDKWKNGNLLYGWMPDAGSHDLAQFECLDPLIGNYTTATIAIHALQQLGFKNIITVGIDFAMRIKSKEPNEEEKTIKIQAEFYGDGTHYRDTYAFGHPVYIADDNYGNEVIQPYYMIYHQRAMEAASIVCTAAGARVINACGWGLFGHEPMMPFDAALEECA